eukprot:TRINITY_DN5132_c0_g1_i2.p1 TRINITY_DN5132_c0_g1~~TRINITY_DN5132_c0_g1_i2.p1  ORF type:complete len:424 (+),score=31.32 TRINITY_DN5132_c0_g1_i2:24-1274(+)
MSTALLLLCAVTTMAVTVTWEQLSPMTDISLKYRLSTDKYVPFVFMHLDSVYALDNTDPRLWVLPLGAGHVRNWTVFCDSLSCGLPNRSIPWPYAWAVFENELHVFNLGTLSLTGSPQWRERKEDDTCSTKDYVFSVSTDGPVCYISYGLGWLSMWDVRNHSCKDVRIVNGMSYIAYDKKSALFYVIPGGRPQNPLAIFAFNGTDGSIRWRANLPAMPGPIGVMGDRVFMVGGVGWYGDLTIHALEPSGIWTTVSSDLLYFTDYPPVLIPYPNGFLVVGASCTSRARRLNIRCPEQGLSSIWALNVAEPQNPPEPNGGSLPDQKRPIAAGAIGGAAAAGACVFLLLLALLWRRKLWRTAARSSTDVPLLEVADSPAAGGYVGRRQRVVVDGDDPLQRCGPIPMSPPPSACSPSRPS